MTPREERELCEHWECSACNRCSCGEIAQCPYTGGCTDCCDCVSLRHEGPAR